MRTRDQISAEIVQEHKAVSGRPGAYSGMINSELAKRLTGRDYLTCEDFDNFDVNCSASCHGKPHLRNDLRHSGRWRHAWRRETLVEKECCRESTMGTGALRFQT